jgi:rod shape-determining protein MreC
LRSGVRSLAYGRGQSNQLDLRFMPANADVKRGDVLVTSGIDGVYPAGLAVATVAQVESQSSDAFARIVCLPAAGVDRNRQLLVLLSESKIPPPPEEEVNTGKPGKKRGPPGAKDGAAREAPAAKAPAGAPAPATTVPAGAMKPVAAPVPAAMPAAAAKPATQAAATPAAATAKPAAAAPAAGKTGEAR